MTHPEKVPLLLGCIADDMTCTSDLASMLVREGIRVVQTIGKPPIALALKSGNFCKEDFFLRAWEMLM